MMSSFDTLAAAEALQDAGAKPELAKAMTAQLKAAAKAGEPVTRPELDAALGTLKAELLERIAASEKSLSERNTATDQRITSVEKNLIERIAASEKSLSERNTATDQRITSVEKNLIERIAASETRLLGRIAETERRLMDRTAAIVWRLFGAMVALAGITVAALEYLRIPAG